VFLSKLVLPLSDPKSQRMLSNLYQLHRHLMTAFPSAAGRVLFRVEPSDGSPAVVVIVQSEKEPSWAKADLPTSASTTHKSFEPKVAAGARLRFRLRANPTRKTRPDDRKHGVRQGVVTEEQQLAWLHKKGEVGGFRVEGCTIIDEKMVSAKKGGQDGMNLTFRSVRYEGVLTVTDPELFAGGMLSGIGSAKGFGFGLLSVARA
jgi:CRISPR system Cascade subunit CasE